MPDYGIRRAYRARAGSEGLEGAERQCARTWLVLKNEVLAFSEAPEREGCAGALLVLLR